MGTTLPMSTAYHPQTDGLTERANRTVEQILRNFVNSLQNDWDEHLASVQFAINSSKQASTRMSPLCMVIGREPVTPASLLRQVRCSLPAVDQFLNSRRAAIEVAKKHIETAQRHQAKTADRSRREVTFNVGDKVRLSTEHTPINVGPAYKLCARFAGPFRITQKIGDVAYKLELPDDWKIHPVFHVDKLQPFNETEAFAGRPRAPRMETRLEQRQQRDVWIIEDILDATPNTTTDGSATMEYLIRWEGYSSENDSWEPWNNLTTGGKDLVESKGMLCARNRQS